MEGSRVASVLVVDLVGSTERLVALGDDEGNRDQVGVLDAFSAAITDAGGRVIKDMGNGVLAVFDTVRQAVVAAIELQRATTGLPAVGDQPARARVGGVGRRGGDPGRRPRGAARRRGRSAVWRRGGRADPGERRGDEAEGQRLLATALALEERSGVGLFAEQTRRDLSV